MAVSRLAQEPFREFEPYTLSGIQVTDRELGRGSYAAVVEIEYRGLKCAGKKIHQAISQQGLTYSLRRFAEECRLLSQMRHPNVVQFLGVIFEDEVAIPILVMEYLPTNLSSCIKEYLILPKEINYSILHDVSLGLSYLHNQTPPIIHRDLSANNVLLTSNMTAKISDLGVAKILNLTPLQMSRMTETPGTPSYMPPEVMVANPNYNESVDIFSYGIMMIHVFSGKWPEPHSESVRTGTEGQLIPVSEAERREEYLHTIGDDHPLMDLILKCIKNDSKRRGNVSEIVQRLKDAVVRFPQSFAKKMEILSRIEALEEIKKSLVADSVQKEKEIVEKRQKVKDMEKENTTLKKQQRRNRRSLEHAQSNEVERLELAHSIEVKQLQSEVEDKNAQVKIITSEKEAIEETLKQNKKIQKRQKSTLTEKDATIKGLNDQLTRTREYLSLKKQPMQANITWKQCENLPMPANDGQTTVINNKVYYGGFVTEHGDKNDCIVYRYDPSQDTWGSLPPLPVRWFGLGQVRGQLVAVGGVRISDEKVSNEVYVFEERWRRWKQSFSSMPTARNSSTVISHPSALIVAGGRTATGHTDVVEILNTETSKWLKGDPLPKPCQDMSSVIVNNTMSCYLVGGYKSRRLNQVWYASVDELLHNAMLLNQPHGTAHTQDHVSVWKKLAHTPTFQSAAVVMMGETILTIGGESDPEYGKEVQSAVYMYSPSCDSWTYISDLDVSRYRTATATLSSTEILVIGGMDGTGRKNTVYKGTLLLQM